MADADLKRNVDAVFGLAPPPDVALSPATRDLAERLSPASRAAERADGAPAARPRRFTPFLREDAARASELAGELSRIVEGEADPAAGLESATAAAAEVARLEPGLARHALGLFAAHDPAGARLPIPSLLARTANFAAARALDPSLTLGSKSTGDEVKLDWFREDPLANEHHEHWHWVYPNNPPAGRPVKKRHGELFYYMHQQMLARYDAERVAVGLPVTAPLTDFDASLGEGYDPGLLETDGRFGARPADGTMTDLPGMVTRPMLETVDGRLAAAARDSRLGPSTGPQTALSGHEGSDLLGHEAEPTGDARFGRHYGNHHGWGHVLIAAASAGGDGVMGLTETAIRDPAFWRWHRHVDDIHFGYQDALGETDFSDAPPVAVTSVSVEPEGAVEAGGAAQELATEMRTGSYTLLNGQAYAFEYLSHVPFQVRAALDNASGADAEVTLRLFLIPHDLFDPDADPTAGDGRRMRRFAIELDKVKLKAPPGSSAHVRAGKDMSVIRRPAVVNPAAVADVAGGATNAATRECTCGWPYGLLLPRGTTDGMAFSLFAMTTDNVIDRVGSPKACGSMSFCGVGAEYPDARAMGYPFDRPLGKSLASLVAEHPNMALSPLVIRWNAPPTS